MHALAMSRLAGMDGMGMGGRGMHMCSLWCADRCWLTPVPAALLLQGARGSAGGGPTDWIHDLQRIQCCALPRIPRAQAALQATFCSRLAGRLSCATNYWAPHLARDPTTTTT